jgi:hypothetical protein
MPYLAPDLRFGRGCLLHPDAGVPLRHPRQHLGSRPRTDPVQPAREGGRYLRRYFRDRDSRFTRGFAAVFAADGIRILAKQFLA